MDSDNVGGFEPVAAVCEVFDHLEESHLVVVGDGVLQWEQPHLLHGFLEEKSALSLNGVDDT